jgi:ribosomal protein L29
MKPLRHEDSVSQVEELQKKLDAALEELAQLKA